ncbi:MAG TPA: glycerophosphodiester phosphodiesterase, partial [Acidimicrobiales bacterium]|nr:glycerophosphodiester phosphodiesterase [Acidimicrobiales bacterium]
AATETIEGWIEAGGDPAARRLSIVVSSFNIHSIGDVKRRGGLETAFLFGSGRGTFDPALSMKLAAEHGHDGVHPYETAVDEDLMSGARSLGLTVRPWTVNDPKRMAELAALGVDALVTDETTLAVAALGGRGSH